MAGGGGLEAPDSGHGQRGGLNVKKPKALSARIDMTPMVDVIMLLLTFFILTTTLAAPQIMQINLPKGDEKDKVKVDMGNVLYIRISDKGNIYFSQGTPDGKELAPENVNLTKVKERLERIYASNNNLLILLKFDRKMKYNKMIDALDEINKAKIERRYTFMKMEDIDREIVRLAGG